MRVRILTETPHVEGLCGDIVEADDTDPTIADLLRHQLLEPAPEAAPAEEPAGKKPRAAKAD
jgi:hypothetical protein